MAENKKKVDFEYQRKGDPHPSRKVSKSKVTEEDKLSKAHKDEDFMNKAKNSNRGGR